MPAGVDINIHDDPVLQCMNKFKNHSGVNIRRIKKKQGQDFDFNMISHKEVLKETKSLNTQEHRKPRNLIFYQKF